MLMRTVHFRKIVLLLFIMFLLTPSQLWAQAAAGESGWDARFGALGVEGTVTALAITADGQLYAGGDFQRAGGVAAAYIAQWNGRNWQAVGSGLNGIPKAMVAEGDDLYVIGDFSQAGTLAVNQLARWDGANWSAVGTGAGAQAEYPTNGRLEALAVANGEVYVGGHFESYEGAPAINLAHWDGRSWAAVGKGVGQTDWEGNLSSYGSVDAILVDDDAIYVGGDINRADDLTINAIAHWDGTTWQALGSGLTDDGADATAWGRVTALAMNGGTLYAAGRFSEAGGRPTNHIAAWDGAQWTPLAEGIANLSNDWELPVKRLLATGDRLFVGGTFLGAGGQPIALLAQWQNGRWSALDAGFANEDGLDWVAALAVAADGTLYSGGRHESVGGKRVDNLARWDGSQWHALSNGLLRDGFSGEPAEVRAIAEDSAGRVFAAGFFGIAGGLSVDNLAMFEGGAWHNIGGSNGTIRTLALDGETLYVGGDFTEIGGIAANHIARWQRDTNQWSTLGNGINGNVHALAVADGILYAGGSFKSAGTVTAEDVAWWDGNQWHPFGSQARIFAVLGAAEMSTYVNALAVADDLVFIGGSFPTIQFGTDTADRNSFVPVNHLIAWRRTTDEWIYVGPQSSPGVTFAGNNELDKGVHALTLIGDLLFVGGKFSQAGTDTVSGLSCWDWQSNQWVTFSSALGAPRTPAVKALAHHGNQLLVGGNFTNAGDAGQVNFVARFDLVREQWSALDGGVKWHFDVDTEVLSLAASASGIYVGGNFDQSGSFPATGFARWQGALTDTPSQPLPNHKLFLPLVQR